jgi:hypothetical protein
MTTRNVPESSVSSHRFVSRHVAQPPILGLVRRGKGSPGYSFNNAHSPDISRKPASLGSGLLVRRRRDNGPLEGERHESEVAS